MSAVVACPIQASAVSRPQITGAVTSAFRVDAGETYRLIEPICGVTRKPEVLKRYDTMRARLTALETRAMGTPFHAILVEAKQNRDGMAATVDCAAPDDGPGTADYVEKSLAKAAQALSRMERTVSLYAPEKG
jgi:hypothetical protein